MATTSTQMRMSGSYGTVCIKDTTAHTQTFTSIVGKADAVIEELYYTGALSTNIVEDLGLDGLTINQFDLIMCKYSKTFGKIKLASGQVFIQ